MSTSRNARKLVVQVVGFMLGLALLGWCVYVALRPENRANLEKLRDAPPSLVLAVIGLSLTTLFLNATTFWTAIFPVKRVPFWDIQATNAGAALCNYAPFKLGAVLRFVVHNRRNGVPLMTIAAWITAVGLTMACALVPLVCAGVWRKQVDWPFIVALVVGLVFTYTTTLLLARAFAGEQGLARLHRITDRFNIRLLNKVLRSRAFQNLHAGFAMMAHPLTFGAGVLLRVADLLVQAARFVVTAKLVGVELGFEGALIISGTYFLISVFSPAGSLGTREGGATGAAKWFAVPGYDLETFVVISLAVTASEMLVNMVCGTIGMLWVRPDRLVQRRAVTDPVNQEGGVGGAGSTAEVSRDSTPAP